MAERGPALVVAACIIQNDAVLLAQRNQPSLPEAHEKWELPGGKVKVGERPDEALRREIDEELGTTIQAVRLLPHVQSNVYHGVDGSISHAVVLAFESVIAVGVPKPRAVESAVSRVQWVARRDISSFSLLPGTEEFVQCIDRLDQASLGAANLFVRLEKRRPGQPTSHWEIQCVPDLWNQFNVIERHVNLETGSTHSKLVRDVPESNLWEHITKRIRKLARHGYVVTYSDDSRLTPGLSTS